MAFKDPEKKKAYQREYAQRPDVKEKRRENYRRWAKDNRSHILEKEARRRLEKRGSCLVATARTRAKKRGLSFDLDEYVADIQERIDNGVCEITGCNFDISPGRSWNSPSLDRIDPTKGYLHDNVRVICHAMNAALGDWGEDVAWNMFQTWAMRSTRK